jgi:hypothetical protein
MRKTFVAVVLPAFAIFVSLLSLGWIGLALFGI